MTMRERMLAVIRGEKHDRVPFVQYDGGAAPNEEVWSLVGRENMGVLRWSRVHSCSTPNCRSEVVEVERDGRKGYLSTLITPAGQLTQEKLLEPAYGSAATRKHYVTDPKDYRVLLAYLRDVVVQENPDYFLNDQAALGDDGVPMVAVRRTPFQQLWIEWVSLEDLCIHMVDCPDLMDEVFAALTDIQRKTFQAVRAVAETVDIPFVDFPDNITAPATGKTYFHRYCVPAYNELAGMLAEKGIPVFVHMDGDLKPLWDSIGNSGVRGIDSFSPQPDNDTTVAEALSMWPDMRLFVNFPSSVHLARPEEVYAQAMRILEEGGRSGRLQIQISESVPRDVWRTSIPEIVRAIRDFAA